MSRLMAFVDGENLTTRFQEMVGTGRAMRTTNDPNPWLHYWAVSHERDKFVWSAGSVRQLFEDEELVRVHYYAMCESGGDETEKLSQQLAGLQTHQYGGGLGVVRTVRLMPRVFQKTKRNTKTKSVDINICVDAMEYVARNSIDSVYLITGDIDYSPLIEAVMRAGKRVYVAALSSGLAPRLRHATDRFVDLDPVYFI